LRLGISGKTAIMADKDRQAGSRKNGSRKGRENGLREYRSKRDPRRTPEPSGRDAARRRRRDGRPRFVVQKHAARTLHYDFRLEVDGVLKSWSVPQGPSTDPREKRLAMPTEDHPLEYADFEGAIPPGEYGAGGVIIWDVGTYDNLTTDKSGERVPVERAIEHGHVSVCLNGDKLTGGWSLTRLRGRAQGRWLLVKTSDEHAARSRDPVSGQPESVRSGRTVDEVAAEAADE
jgi:DNA ligase D-like protein (predicted 3'-phosphoesterase)